MAAVPWQKLADFEKERGVKQARQISFGKGAHVCGPWQIGDDTPLPSFVDYAASYASAGEVLHGDSSAIEFWFLAIDWNFPREKIEKVILSWLNGQIAQKRGRVPRFSRQGKDKSDFARSWLMALGAKRLLDSGLTVPDASKYSARVSGAIPSPLFTDKSEWSKARRRAETRLALLFPAAELGE